ncbi:hypothetical protein [Microlunatus phosphovorus]|nr:hypothetical protein [Microlunatus phosphovorus]
MSDDDVPAEFPQPEPEGGEQNSDYSVPDVSEEGVDDDSSAVG